MTLAGAALGLLAEASLVCGGLAILSLIPSTPWWSQRAARLALAHLAGSATMAWTATVLALATGHLQVFPVYGLFVFIALLSWWSKGTSPFHLSNPQKDESSQPSGTSPWEMLAICAVVLGIVSTGWGLSGDPNMTLDAHWNWALKAKAMYLAGSFHPIVAQCCTKPNYPVLFPLQSWWIFSHLRGIDEWWPRATGFFFYLDLVVLTFAACRAHMRSNWAWIATAIVANDPLHVLMSSEGEPDSAIAAFILSSSIFLAAYLAKRENASRVPALLLLLGASQTKNEGLAWAAFATVLLVVFDINWRDYRRAAIPCAWFLIAVAPWELFKHRHAMAYGPEEQLASALTLKLEWAHRIKEIIRAHISDPIPNSPFFVLLLCIPLMLRRWSAMIKPMLALFAAQISAYLVVYFIVANQAYQLHFVKRGFSQISPALICICLIGYHRVAEAKRESELDEQSPVEPVALPSAA
jgi:hypothetical protein